MWALNSNCVYSQVKVDTVGATSPRVNIETIKETLIPIPPIAEQEQISNQIYTDFQKINLLKESSLQNISLLNELKQILIAEAVTGKIKI